MMTDVVCCHDMILTIAQGLLIVSACGFDSIPNDMGTLFTISSFPEGVTPSAIDSFACVNSGTQSLAIAR
jgi:short subunit dehydrogenase-like uncharacterized protein